MKYNQKYQRLNLSSDPFRNRFRINGDDFILEELEAGNRGGNSCVFRAQHPDGDEAYIVKFSRYLRESDYSRDQMRLQRFEREIQALRIAASSEFSDSVVPIIDDGVRPLDVNGARCTLRYYVMEEAEGSLSRFLAENSLSLPQKILLCSDLLKILKQLHSLNIYHRDIKPDNIFMVSGRPILGDLGLINFRNPDSDLDEFDEKVGPLGYLSPEATNKCLGIRGRNTFTFDCWMDEKSDLFQLGQVFWLVLQDEVPTGHLQIADLKIECTGVLASIIQPMLQYGKTRRATADQIEEALRPFLREYAIA